MSPKIPPSTQTASWTWWLDLFLLGILGFFFYQCWLGAYPLIPPDEARYSEVAREMLASGNFITPMVNGIPFLDKPPLFYWLEAGFMHLLGVNEIGIRTWPTLAATLGILLNYGVGRVLVSRRLGLMAGSLLGSLLFPFAMGHYANMDLTVALWISAALYAYLLSTEASLPPGKQHILLYFAYFFMGLGVLSKGLMGLALPAGIVFLHLAFTRRLSALKQLRIPTGLLLIAIMTLPWFWGVAHENPGFWHYYFVVQQFERYLTADFNGHHGLWFYPAVILVGILPWTGYFLGAFFSESRNILQKKAPPLITFLWTWVWFILIFFSIPSSKLVGYILPVFPPIALITALYFNASQNQPNRHFSIVHGLTLATLILAVIALALFLAQASGSEAPLIQAYLTIPLLIISLAALLLVFSWRPMRPLWIFNLILCTTLALDLSVLYGISQLHSTLPIRSTLALTKTLRTFYQPGDRVLCFDTYYQDIPIYLGKTVTLVYDYQNPRIAYSDTWAREFSIGLTQARYQTQVWNTDQLAKAWPNNQRLFVYLNQDHLQNFKTWMKKPVYLLGRDQDLLLLSNRPSAIR